jgi:hypothetical protein
MEVDVVDQIEIRQWVKRGIFIVNVDALDIDDPDHPYNQCIAQGGIPEQFGLYHPEHERLEHMSREQLIQEVISLSQQVKQMEKWF